MVLALAGLAVGSFLNVVIVRMPAEEPVFGPGWRCPECDAPIARRDALPLLGWLGLRGRCRSCREPIPLGYPLVELLTAVLWVAAGVRFGATWELLPYLFLFSVLLAQSVIDLELYRLLDRITFPALGVSILALAAVAPSLEDPRSRLLGALVGSVGYFLFLGIPALVYPRGMGLGDVKLAALMGLYLGYINPILVLFSVIIACLLGIVAGLALFFARGRKSEGFPFGPWLASGCVIAVLLHTTLVPPA